VIDNLSTGFAAALTPENLLWCFVGVLLGSVIGILPGLGSATAVAILIPVTLTFEPLTALTMLAGIYHGAQFCATITAILAVSPAIRRVPGGRPGRCLLGGDHVRRLPAAARRAGRPCAGHLRHRLLHRRAGLAGRAGHRGAVLRLGGAGLRPAGDAGRDGPR